MKYPKIQKSEAYRKQKILEKTEEYLKSDTFKKILEEGNLELKDFTCYDCLLFKECEFSFDIYNINGDCLFAK